VNSLDELFGEALDRAATPTTQERRAAVAEVTVHGARRRRRVRAVGQAAGTLVVAAVVVGAGALLLNRTDAPPANGTPTPTQPAPSASATQAPIVTTEADPRMPQAPAMTREDWADAGVLWDAELASFRNISPVTTGSTLAIYLTPPDGTRKLAYATANYPDAYPALVAFDPATHLALVFNSGPRTISAVNLGTGAISDFQIAHEDTLVAARSLGRLLDGTDVFFLETVSTGGEYTQTVYRLDGDTPVPQHTAQLIGISRVWGNTVITQEADAMVLLDISSDGSYRRFPALVGCSFQVWNQDGSFVVNCPGDQDATGDYYSVDPATGAKTLLWADQSYESFDVEDPEFTTIADRSWIDTTRSYEASDLGLGAVQLPPTVYDTRGDTVDLGADFASIPESYAVIFGVRD
jgi:hypothetical protein